MSIETEINLGYGETVAVAVTLRRDGVGTSISGATVTLSLVWDKEPLGREFGPAQPTEWNAGSTLALEAFTCTPDADQSANPGKLTFTPTTAFYTACPPGVYRMQFKCIFADLTVQKFPRSIRDSAYRLEVHESVDGLDDES
jgi:hypothetical protein